MMDGNPLPDAPADPRATRLAMVCGWTYKDAVVWLATYDDCGWILDPHTNLTGAAEFVCSLFDVPTGDLKDDVRREMDAMGLPTDDVDGDDGDYLAPGVADHDGDDVAYLTGLVADDAGGGP